MPKKVLVVEDSSHIFYIISEGLHDAGYVVIPAFDGLSATEIIKDERVDLVITDYEMPRMNGAELCKYLRGCPLTRNLPVILLSSRASDLNEEKATKIGFTAVLEKPFSMKDLLALVRDTIGNSKD